jgi:flagellar hook-associated protein 2
MSSGLDTESLVSALVLTYTNKKDDLVKAQTKLSWKQDKWKSINTSVYSFYTSKLSSMRFTSNYNLKKASISNSSYATVSASSSAVNGTQSLKVKKLAATGYLTGGQLESDTTLSTSSKLSDIAGMAGLSGSISVSVSGSTSNIDITSDTTIKEFVTSLKNAGLNASYDETYKRFFISAKSSGEDNDFSLTAADENGSKILSALRLNATTSETVKNDITKYQNIVSQGKDAYVSATAADKYQSTVAGYNESIASLKEKNETLASDNDKLSAKVNFLNKVNELLDYTAGDVDENGNQLASSDSIAAVKDAFEALKNNDYDGYSDEQKAAYDEVVAMFDGESNFTKTKVTETLNDVTTVSYVSAFDQGITDANNTISSNDATINENINTVNGYYGDVGHSTISSTGDMEDISEDVPTGTTANNLYDKYVSSAEKTYEYAEQMVAAYNVAYYGSDDSITADMYSQATAKFADVSSAKSFLGVTDSSDDTTAAVRIAGSNSMIELNGATFENTTNNFSINGLTIQATALTGDETVTITTSTDVDAIYDNIKDFFSEYNTLIKTLETAYNADSASDYEPLTSDEKDEMSDSEVEKWETKIKDALLRKDSTLSGVIQAMKNSMLSAYEVNGKKYSLANFGIATGSYFSTSDNEHGVYHIDGDEDDSLTASNTDKLREMIANDPDTVVSFFSQLSNDLYSALAKKMSTSSLSSAFTIYNDKEMSTQYSDYTTKISDAETKISTWEEYYYSKFTRMESALALLNSQSSSLSGLFG